MADKIDDVRRHQKTANEAYKEGTSVMSEFSTMNNTVQARLDKCRKQFLEMTVELGEKLMPVVKYTISGFSLMVKGLSAVTTFVLENKAAILSAAAAIVAYTAYVNTATVVTKVYTAATKIAEMATKAFNLATKMNPIGLLIAALTAAVVLFVKYRDRINGATEAVSMLKQAGARLAEVLAQVTGWVIKLVKWAVSLYDKFSFIRKIIQLMTTAFTAGFSTITNGVKFLMDELGAVANIIEGMFTLDWNKIKEGFKQGFKAVVDAAITQFNIVKREVKDTFSAPPPANGFKAVAAGEKAAQGPKELPEVVVTGNRKGSTGTRLEGYKTEEEQRREERERKKREAEEEKRIKKRVDAVKAQYQAELACEMDSYMKGAVSYGEFMDNRHALCLQYYDALKKIYGEDSDQYKKLLDDRAREEQKYNEEHAKLPEQAITAEHLEKERNIRKQYMRKEVVDEEALNEALFQNDMEYMRKKRELYYKDPKRWAEMEMEIQQKQKEEQFRKEQAYMEKLRKFREEAGRLDYDKLLEIELEGAGTFYSALVERGEMTKEEYDAVIEHIRRKYAGLKAEQAENSEVARITANYDKQIAAAGKNSKKRERLEKQKDEAIAKAKTAANKKAMAMEMAQAVAQTAMGAISAYSTTMAGAPYPANLVLAPISAGIALAAGALQIATIKKQHQAEAAGYYEGGFTGCSRYRKEAGVVHEGEFVANHYAVNNRQLMPLFSLLDLAQRNNRVGSLKAEDVTNAMGGNAAQVVAPVVNVQASDNTELRDTLKMVCEIQERLATQLEQGIGVDVPIAGENGIYTRLRRYTNLLKNK